MSGVNNTKKEISFYNEYIASRIPANILDFHAHIWKQEQWINGKNVLAAESERYMVTEKEYPAAALAEDAGLCFPGKKYYAVCFGHPAPVCDTDMTNAYVAECAGNDGGLFPLIVAGGGRVSPDKLEEQLDKNGFFGYKVFLNWVGNDYGHIAVEDMLTPFERKLADRRRLIILLHVPGAGRLADPEIQRGVINLAQECPNANIVLAHCGRCYHPLEIIKAAPAMKIMAGLGNVYMDTAMVMDPAVIETAIKIMGPDKLLFATDFPVAAMRGRRVNIMDHWVDVVEKNYPDSDYRVASDMFSATYMAREICLAVIIAAETAGLDANSFNDIFFENGMKLLRNAIGGKFR